MGDRMPFETPYGLPPRKREGPSFAQAPELEPVVPQRGATKQRQRLERVMDRLNKSAKEQKRLGPVAPAKYVGTRAPQAPAASATSSAPVDLKSLRPKIQDAITKFFGEEAGRTVALALEAHAWKLHEESGVPYRKRCRTIYEILKSSPDTRRKLLGGELKPEDFVERCESDFVSAEVKEGQATATRESLKTVTCDLPSRMRSTEHVCPTCGANDTEFSLLTSHRTSGKCDTWGSKDVTERDSIRVFCRKCTAEWSATF